MELTKKKRQQLTRIQNETKQNNQQLDLVSNLNSEFLFWHNHAYDDDDGARASLDFVGMFYSDARLAYSVDGNWNGERRRQIQRKKWRFSLLYGKEPHSTPGLGLRNSRSKCLFSTKDYSSEKKSQKVHCAPISRVVAEVGRKFGTSFVR